jgi:hypothetical protein
VSNQDYDSPQNNSSGNRDRIRIPVTRKPWFGPKRVGVGLSPRSWQGWLVMAVFVAALVVLTNVFPNHFWIPLVVSLACLGLVVYLTYERRSRNDRDQP